FVSRFHALLPPLDPSAQLHEKKDTQRLYPTRQDFHRLSWTFAGCRDSGRSSPLFTHSGRVSHERCLRDASLSKIEAVTSDGAGLMRRRRRRGARCSSASIAANSLSMARAHGAPSVSLRWLVSARSSRTRSEWRASSRSPPSACSTRSASRRLNVPAACHGSRASILWRFLLIVFITNLVRFLPPTTAALLVAFARRGCLVWKMQTFSAFRSSND